MKKARVLMTRAWLVKAAAERPEANEGGREEEENDSGITALFQRGCAAEIRM
jgi:hypothetical protein